MDAAPRQCTHLHHPISQAVSEQQNITVMEYPPYSPDLVLCYLFHAVKSRLKGTHFALVEEDLSKMENLLNGLPKASF
ncbi:hypothetical protein TNCV_2538511 [Trichonephila clavipes]|nr:hypothetical protein TNCV_2538511 [Trichonephila clavipes]